VVGGTKGGGVVNGEELEQVRDPISTEKWPTAFTVSLLLKEIERCRMKFPGNRFLLVALVEEVGELAEALVSGTKEEIVKEAVQVACVAVRIAEEGDATSYTPGFFIALVSSTGRVARNLLQRGGIQVYLSVASGAAQRMKEQGGDPTFADITDEEAKP